MKIFMTGGTGYVGSALTRAFLQQGHEVTILTRKDKGPLDRQGLSFLTGDPAKSGAWQDTVPEHDIVVNLAGASIFERWTEEEDGKLRSSLAAGRSHEEVVALLGRSQRAVEMRLVKLGLSKPGDSRQLDR